MDILESNPIKKVDNIIKIARDKAASANLKGDTKKEKHYSNKLSKVLSYRNNILSNTLESHKQLLDHHVTSSNPSLENINRMHDIVRHISKTYNIPASKLYDQIKNNAAAHNSYRQAASEE